MLLFWEGKDPWSVFMVAAEFFEVILRANKGLGLDLKDRTALLKVPLKI